MGPPWIAASWRCPRSKIQDPRAGGSPCAGLARWSRPLDGTPKTVTISREADGYYVCCSCADVPVRLVPATGQETGVDVGLASFATLASGRRNCNPRWYRKAERRLKRAQRRVSRRQNGSHRRHKAVTRRSQGGHRAGDSASQGEATAVRRPPQGSAEGGTAARQDRAGRRAGRHHAKESLPGKEPLGCSRRISEASWAQVRAILAAKAASAGCRVVAAPPASTSQDCRGCGRRVWKSLSMRTHVCPNPTGGLVLDREENAARNRERAGQALRGAVA